MIIIYQYISYIYIYIRINIVIIIYQNIGINIKF